MSQLFDIHYNGLSKQIQKTVCGARISAMLARRAAINARSVTTEMNNAVPDNAVPDNAVYWYIDRTPDYSIFQNINGAYRVRHHIDIFCKQIMVSEEEQNCCVCIEIREKDEICRFNCQHTFCGECINNIMKTQTTLCCPICRTNIINITVQKNKIQEKLLETLR